MQLVKNLERFRLVTFDITDTLLRFTAHPATIYKNAAVQFGFTNIDELSIIRNFREQFKEMTTKYPNFGHKTPNMTWQQWWLLLVSETFVSVDPSISRESENLKLLNEHLLRIFRTNSCYESISCGETLVQRVRQTGKCLGVISNNDPSLIDVLKAMNIDGNFDFVLTSYEVGIEKPDCGIFNEALKCAGDDIEPHESLHIGNNFELDYLGAKNAGWSSLLVAEKSTKLEAVPDDHIYSNITEMLSALETKQIKW